MGSLAVGGDGILHTSLSSRLSPSSPSFPFRRSDSPPFFIPGRFDDGILHTPHFSTCLPYPSSLRLMGSSPWRSGPPQKASATPVSRSTPSSILAHLLSFSPIPFPHFPPSLLISLPLSLLFLDILPSSPPYPIFSFHFTPFFFTFVKWRSQCAVPCPFLADNACHFVSLCRPPKSSSSFPFLSFRCWSKSLFSCSFPSPHFPRLAKSPSEIWLSDNLLQLVLLMRFLL